MKKFFSYIWRKRAAYLMVAPLIIGVLIFCYYPPISGIMLSFTNKTISLSDKVEFVWIDNYKAIFSDPIFLNSFKSMLIIQIPRLITGIFVPLIYAEIIFNMKSLKAQSVYRLLVLLPVVAPGVVFNLVWKQIYNSDPSALMNSLVRAFGLLGENEGINWLNAIKSAHTIFAILFMGFPWIGGSQVLVYMAGLLNIPKEMFEAADLDGAGAFKKIWYVHIPLVSGQIRYFLIFGIFGGLQDYGTQVVLTKGGPGYSTYVPGYYMYELMYSHGEYGKASAIGVVLFVIILVLTIIAFKFVKFGGSKEDV
mgnify:FL=1